MKGKTNATYITPDNANGEGASCGTVPSPLMSFCPCSTSEPTLTPFFHTSLTYLMQAKIKNQTQV